MPIRYEISHVVDFFLRGNFFLTAPFQVCQRSSECKFFLVRLSLGQSEKATVDNTKATVDNTSGTTDERPPR